MLPKILSDYLNQLEQAIIQCQNVYIERYDEEILTSQRVNLKIRFEHLLLKDSFLTILNKLIYKNIMIRYFWTANILKIVKSFNFTFTIL